MLQMLYRTAGERVRVRQPETSCRLPPGLNDGDEVTIVSGWDHSYYGVEKDGVTYLVSFMCIPHEHVTIPDGPATSATRGMPDSQNARIAAITVAVFPRGLFRMPSKTYRGEGNRAGTPRANELKRRR